MSSARAFYRDRYRHQTEGAPGPEAEATFALRVQAALAAIGPSPRRVLDFGCGTGAASKLLVEAGHSVIGVDVSESGIDLARRAAPDATFVPIESESSLPFPEAAFDVCFCTEVIEHLLDVRGFVHEVHRVLAPGGLFLITTPYHSWLKNLLIITFTFEKHFNVAGCHIRFFTRQSLTRCLAAGGFAVEQFRGIGRCWPVWKTMFVVARRTS